MADSILSIIIRDPTHPCAPYQSTGHSFRVQIFHCDGTPLFWKGVNLGIPGVWLTQPGIRRGRIHAQLKVPPGCYLIRAIAQCKNVVSDWAYVGVGCDQTVCVSLTIPTVRHCIQRVIAGLNFGTLDPPGGEERVADVLPEEVKEATRILKILADKLPPESPEFPTPPAGREIAEWMQEEKAE